MNLFDILIIGAIASVAITLALGVQNLARTGDEARSRSNKLMRIRVMLQALAIVLLLGGLWWKSTHGG
jgi:hypothetical protein